MTKVVRFSAMPTFEMSPPAALAAIGNAPCGVLATAPSAHMTAMLPQVTETLDAPAPTPSAPCRKRQYQHAFGVAGSRLAQAPRPAAGSMPISEWL